MSSILNLPASFAQDLLKFRDETERFKQGVISLAEYRAFRVPRGVYEQREANTYMLRTRCPAGAVLPHQLRTLAAVSQRYGNGVLHVTTRQDIQVHRVLLDDLHAALTELHAAGLSTRGGGGNTVRNITGCYDAGVCADEAFDVSPYVVALTESLLPDPVSYQLPRKYKIAFSGCSRDCAGATVNDLGFVAKTRHGASGFAVYVGGGMGARSRVGQLFEPFVPGDQIYLVAEAIKRVFDQHGNRKDRNRARLRFLVEQIGLSRFRELYERELESLRAAQPAGLAIRPVGNSPDPVPNASTRTTSSSEDGDYAAWHLTNVVPQRQDGYHLVHIPLELGDIHAVALEKLADLLDQHGEHLVRTTQSQNFVLRWVHEDELRDLHAKLKAWGLATAKPPVLRNLISCTGAATCKLGVCLSRGLARAIAGEVSAADLELNAAKDLRIHISGCPNSCGRHPIADIGLRGVARRAHGRLVPHYVLQVGGRVSEQETRFAEGQQAIPAKSLPILVRELLAVFGRSAQYPDFGDFLDAGGRQVVEALGEQYKDVPDFECGRDYYIDWGAENLFSLAGRGPGECGAGVFDLIEVDLQSARDALEQQHLRDAVVLAARALLVTRGEQANDARSALDLFRRFFVEEGLVDTPAAELVAQARQAEDREDDQPRFEAPTSAVAHFVAAIEQLYANMDASLRFKPAAPETLVTTTTSTSTASTTSAAVPLEIARKADFRGVVCPLNYVKTKLVLGQMGSGELLSVVLDEPGARNVPDSVRQDGHEIVSLTLDGDHWQLVIRKS